MRTRNAAWLIAAAVGICMAVTSCGGGGRKTPPIHNVVPPKPRWRRYRKPIRLTAGLLSWADVCAKAPIAGVIEHTHCTRRACGVAGAMPLQFPRYGLLLE